MQNKRDYSAWLPLAIAISVIGGMVIGIFMGNPFSNGQHSTQSDRKLNTILNLISQEYVDDSIKTKDLIEMSIPAILANLDPHSSYLSAADLKAAQEELNGSFSGIGVSFQLMNDTIVVVEVIPGGPSDRAGLVAGDMIVTIEDSTFAGNQVDANKVREKLRGTEGTKVKVGIARDGSNKLQGAKRFMVDLRGNGGGYLDIAIIMVNEFLPENRLIVSTKGRHRRDETTAYSDGRGQFQDEELVVLIDEFSASASEIFAGAIQDNDRGLVVGCRSFGKGLVQKQFDLPDKSAVRLTIAKYYTPSGRCIQKPYNNGESAYQKDILDRYSNGELYSKDSIKIDKSKIFETTTGRKVYGGGGIIPDIFVPRDTTGFSSYYAAVAAAGLLQEYALKYVTARRASLNKMSDYKQLMRNLPANDDLLNDFVKYAADKGVPARWHYIHQSQDIIPSVIKALIASDIFGKSVYYPIVNRTDKTIETALKALNKHKAAFPITNY